MSLTREQWLEMWKDIKQIEEMSEICTENNCIDTECGYRKSTQSIVNIKNKIELVIGQVRTTKEEL